MILATSRFRVANGMEQEVRAAFADRPRLVDASVGFLGMDVFTEHGDATIFHLVTRWTDSSAFRAWHGSAAHRQSHAGIPRGVRLDAKYTSTADLDRIEPLARPGETPSCVLDHATLLSSFVSASPTTHVVIAGRDGVVSWCNAAVEQAFNTGAGEVTGTSLWIRMPDADAARLRSVLVDGSRRPADSILLNFVAVGGARYTLRCQVDVTPSGFILAGEPASGRADYEDALVQLNNDLIVLGRENTRRGRELADALLRLKETQAMLVHREKLASLGVMTAGIAHEINNPLAFVLGNEETLRRDVEELLRLALADRAALSADERAEAEYLARSIPKKLAANETGLRRMQQIVLDLRTFARLDESGFKHCDLAENIKATLVMLGPLLREHDVGVEVSAPGVPPLLCAPGPFNQAFANVIINAVQASAPGQGVTVTVRDDNGECLIEVADSGCGIAPENLPKVFDAFFTTKPVGTGTGLGLHIAHQIIQAHHGTIAIDSPAGGGTVVRIRVPWEHTVRSNAVAPEESCISK